ncbi:MAG: enoyl-CoA hydratase/isomerase family protein [Planctomycetota bacterium]
MSKHLDNQLGDTWRELTMNRPDCRNALSHELIADLTAAIQQASSDKNVRSMILTGTPPSFCAGLDLREVTAADTAHDISPLLTLLKTLEDVPKPVIAAVNGPAMAGGAVLVAACDLAICAESASIGYPGVRRGLVAPILMTYLCRQVGERHARYLLLTGLTVDARQALTMGLVNEVVADRELMTRARRLAAHFAKLPASALAQAKAMFTQRHDQSAAGTDILSGSNTELPLSSDSRAELKEFLES